MAKIISVITISFSALLLSYVFFMSSQSLILVQAQDSTNVTQPNNTDSKIYIPPTISKGAQEILKSSGSNDYVYFCNTSRY